MRHAKKSTPQKSRFSEVHVSPRGQKAVPPALQEIIDLVNLPGPSYEIPRTVEFGVRYKLPEWFVPMPPHNPFELTYEQYEQLRQGWFRTLRLQLDARLPKAFADYLKTVMDNPEMVGPGLTADEAALLRCEDIRRWQHNLRIIARRENSPIINESVIYFDYATGTKHESKDQLLEALDSLKDDGDVRYIRECMHCRKIYFAGKLVYKGQEVLPTCSRACRKAIHNKRSKARKVGDSDLVNGVVRLLNKWPQFRRDRDLSELAAQAGITLRQANRVLDFREQQKESAKRAVKARKR